MSLTKHSKHGDEAFVLCW